VDFESENYKSKQRLLSIDQLNYEYSHYEFAHFFTSFEDTGCGQSRYKCFEAFDELIRRKNFTNWQLKIVSTC